MLSITNYSIGHQIRDYYYIHLTDADQVSEVSFDFAVVDSNSLMFVFHHAPEVAKELHGDKELTFDTVAQSDTQAWKVISYIFTCGRS